MKIAVSENIRLIREAKGFSQEFVAKKLKVTQQAYSSMEKTPENMTLKRLRDLCEVLDVDLITLLGEDNVYLQQNYNQQGGNAATQMILNGQKDAEDSIHQSYINSLKEEIAHLKKIQEHLISKQSKK